MGVDVGEGGVAEWGGRADVSVRPAHAAPPSENASDHETAADGFTDRATIACTKRSGSPSPPEQKFLAELLCFADAFGVLRGTRLFPWAPPKPRSRSRDFAGPLELALLQGIT
jgi:hypothetical protein